MRRAIGLTLAGLGAFLLVVAVLLRTYVPGHVMKYPLNEYLVTQLVGHGTDYFSPNQVWPITGATMVVTSTVKGDAGAGNSSTAVWDSFTYLYDETDHARYLFSTAASPSSGAHRGLITCCGANVPRRRLVDPPDRAGGLPVAVRHPAAHLPGVRPGHE